MQASPREYYLTELGIEAWCARAQLPGAKIAPYRQAYPASELLTFTDKQLRLSLACQPGAGFIITGPLDSPQEQALASAFERALGGHYSFALAATGTQPGQTSVDLAQLLPQKPHFIIMGLALAQQLCPKLTQRGWYQIDGCDVLVTFSLAELVQQPLQKKVLWSQLQK